MLKKPDFTAHFKAYQTNFILLLVIIILFVILNNRIPSSVSDPTKVSPSLIVKAEIELTPKPSPSLISIETSPVPTVSTIPLIKATPINIGKNVSVPIIYYHYIGNNPNPADKARDSLSVTPDKFDEELGYLSSAGYTGISLDTLYAALMNGSGLPAKPIILSFDDGYIDFYLNAFPILHKYNFHSVSFIPTGLIGKSSYMNWSQIKEIDATGLVSFQAHSITHANLTSLSNEQLTLEITQSKKDLESQLGKPVNFFAYPNGISDQRVWNSVKSAGFVGATGTWGGKIQSESNIFNMPRLRVAGGWTLDDFKIKLGL